MLYFCKNLSIHPTAARSLNNQVLSLKYLSLSLKYLSLSLYFLAAVLMVPLLLLPHVHSTSDSRLSLVSLKIRVGNFIEFERYRVTRHNHHITTVNIVFMSRCVRSLKHYSFRLRHGQKLGQSPPG